MANRQPNDYTVVELKEILREENLSTVGNKGELLNWLDSYNPNIWSILNEEHKRVQDTDQQSEEDEESREGAVGGINERYERNDTVITENSLAANDLIRRENELLKRERAVLQRELELMRQGYAGNRDMSRANETAGRRGTPRGSVNVNENVRAIRDLLSEFNGSEGTF